MDGKWKRDKKFKDSMTSSKYVIQTEGTIVADQVYTNEYLYLEYYSTRTRTSDTLQIFFVNQLGVLEHWPVDAFRVLKKIKLNFVATFIGFFLISISVCELAMQNIRFQSISGFDFVSF